MKPVFLFPGQGAELIGLGQHYLDRSGPIRKLFKQVDERLQMDLGNVLAYGPPRLLATCRVAQPVTYVIAYANATWLRERGIDPALVAGHSLGQFTATAIADAVAPDVMLDVVIERGRLMDAIEARDLGGMMALDGASRARIDATIAELDVEAWISNINAPTQYVVSGCRGALRSLQEKLQPQGVTCRWLNIGVPAHSPLMTGPSAQLANLIDKLDIRDPTLPVLASHSGLPLASASALRDDLKGHMHLPVNWMASMARISRDAYSPVVECGPGRVLKGLALRNKLSERCFTTGTLAELKETVRLHQGALCAQS